jgi:hypothetical protein
MLTQRRKDAKPAGLQAAFFALIILPLVVPSRLLGQRTITENNPVVAAVALHEKSDFSVQPLCPLCLCGCFSNNSLTTEAQRTQRLHREEVRRTFRAKPAAVRFADFGSN